MYVFVANVFLYNIFSPQNYWKWLI